MSLYSTLLGNSSYRRQKEGMLRSEAGKRGDDHEKKNEEEAKFSGRPQRDSDTVRAPYGAAWGSSSSELADRHRFPNAARQRTVHGASRFGRVNTRSPSAAISCRIFSPWTPSQVTSFPSQIPGQTNSINGLLAQAPRVRMSLISLQYGEEKQPQGGHSFVATCFTHAAQIRQSASRGCRRPLSTGRRRLAIRSVAWISPPVTHGAVTKCDYG